MLKKILYCTLLLHFIPTYLFAQTTTPPEIEWQRFWGYAYSPYDFEWKNNTKIFVTADSNYIFAANPNLAQSVTEDLGTCSNVNGSIFVVKMARNGHVLWRKQYQNSFNLCDFRPTNDGGYVLLTAIQSLNFGGQPVITKIDQNGAVIWQRLYADIQYITGYQNGGILRSIRPTADGGYIVLARTSAVTGPWQVTYPQISQTPTDILVFKVNSTGFLSWSKIIGGSERDTPRAIAEMPDGSFILGITTSSIDGDIQNIVSPIRPQGNIWLCKLSATGAIIGNKVIGSNNIDTITELTSIENTPDGNLILTGSTDACDGDFTYTPALGSNLLCPIAPYSYTNNIFTIKIKPDFTILWKKRIGGRDADRGFYTSATPDGGCISCGYTHSIDEDAAGNSLPFPNSTSPKSVWLIKRNTQGDVEWQKFMGADVIPQEIRATPDGGYIFIGGFNHHASGEETDFCGMQNPAEPEYWIVKLKNAPPPPRIDGITSIDCHSTTTLTAIQDEPVPTPVKRYEWSTGDSTQAIQVGAAAGTSTYTVTITYENRCTKVVSVQVNVTGHLSFLNPVINSAICTAHTGNIQVNVQDGVAPYSYSWNVAGTTAILPNLSTGTYTATATDANNCTGSATFVVPLQIDTVHWQQPTFTPQICNTGGSFTATPSSGTAPYTYQNSQNTTTNTLTNLVAGNYSVSATDANGCTGSTIVVITQQNPIIAANLSVAQPFCAGQTGSILCLPQGGTAPYTVLPTVLTGLNSGTYTVSVSDANGCNTTASAVVAAPLPLTISLLSQNSTCGLQNGSMTVLPQGGTAPYMVSPSILTGLPAGNYTVSVTDAHNCSVSTTTTLTATPPITADVVTTNPICYGDASGSIALNNIQNAVPPVVFSVDNGTFAPSNPIVNVTSGLHIVTLQDAANCTLSNSVTLAEGYSFSVNIGRDTALHFGDSLLLTAVLQGGNLHPPYVLTWAQDNTTVAITNTTANTTTNTNSVLIFPSFGGGFGGSLTLSVRATDTNGCIATDKLVAEIKDGNSVYLPNTITPNGDGKNDYFVIFGGVNVKTVKLLRIFDRYGELVYEKHDFAPNTPTWDGTWARYATAYVAPAWGGQGGVGFGFSKTDAAIDVYAVYTEVELMDGTIKAFIQDLTVVR